MTEQDEEMEKTEMKELMKRSVIEITGRVAGLEVDMTPPSAISIVDTDSLVVHTKGDYAATIVMSAHRSFFSEVARRMKKSEKISEQDIAIYVTEYYNILCGFFISHFNSREHLRARFGIPRFVSGCCVPELSSGSGGIELYFKSRYGSLCMSGIGLP